MANKTRPKPTKSGLSVARAIPFILLIGGIVGLIAASVLTYDHNKLSVNPNYIPSCNLNPIVACGTVIKSKQAEAFHFPNPYIGLVAFPMLITTGMAMLAGATFKRWFWWLLEAGTLFGLGFVHWLFYQTVYNIHALCPYCIAVWIVTITTFWYVTLYNIDQKRIPLPKQDWAVNSYAWIRRHHLDLLILWFVIIAGLILKHFWYYYGHYF